MKLPLGLPGRGKSAIMEEMLGIKRREPIRTVQPWWVRYKEPGGTLEIADVYFDDGVPMHVLFTGIEQDEPASDYELVARILPPEVS
jgi:hypothetical protein